MGQFAPSTNSAVSWSRIPCGGAGRSFRSPSAKFRPPAAATVQIRERLRHHCCRGGVCQDVKRPNGRASASANSKMRSIHSPKCAQTNGDSSTCPRAEACVGLGTVGDCKTILVARSPFSLGLGGGWMVLDLAFIAAVVGVRHSMDYRR
jgi:hypothetical protein